MACASCDLALSPTGPRRGEHHFGVRYGFQDGMLWALKDGEVILDAYEVDVLAGKAWRYEVPYRLCPCQPHSKARAAAYIDIGNFAVTNAEPRRERVD